MADILGEFLPFSGSLLFRLSLLEAILSCYVHVEEVALEEVALKGHE
jgi:hypothetical protein